MSYPRLTRLAFLLTLGGALAAQSADDLEKELAALLNTPIQGASKREQRLIDSPQAIEVLSGDELRAMGVYRLGDALKLMTSVDVLELDNLVTNVTLRGAMQQGQPRTAQILLDGVPLYNAEIASVDIDNLPVPMDLVDKIEVVRGPSSSLYGANAVVGVIAITTRRPGDGFNGGLRASRADHSTSRGSADVALGTKDLGLTVGYQGASLGTTNQVGSSLNTGTPQVYDDNHSHQRSTYARGQWNLGEASLWLSAGAAEKWAGTFKGGNAPYQVFTTSTTLLGWSQAWSSNLRTELRWSHLKHEDAFGPYPAIAGITGDSSYLAEKIWASFTSNLIEFQLNWDPSKTFHVVGGLDRRTYSAEPSSIIGFPKTYDESASGGFINLDWNATDTMTVSAGARAENESLGGSRTSPRFAILWNTSKSSTFRVGYYSSSRSPQVLESRVDFTNTFTPPIPPLPPGSIGVFRIVPNQALEPEKVTSMEVGYRHILGSVSLDITAFQMNFTKLITQVQKSQQTVIGVPVQLVVTNQYVNTGDAKDKGLELALTWRPDPKWTCGFNGTWLDYKLDATGTTPTYTPKLKANLWARFTSGSLSAYAAFQHVDEVDMEVLGISGTGSPLVKRDAINQLNLHLAKTFPGGWGLAVYSRNALKDYTDQGGGGPTRVAYLMSARRESGLTLSYRF